jgi:hypothetical protein
VLNAVEVRDLQLGCGADENDFSSFLHTVNKVRAALPWNPFAACDETRLAVPPSCTRGRLEQPHASVGMRRARTGVHARACIPCMRMHESHACACALCWPFLMHTPDPAWP